MSAGAPTSTWRTGTAVAAGAAGTTSGAAAMGGRVATCAAVSAFAADDSTVSASAADAAGRRAFHTGGAVATRTAMAPLT